MESEIEDNFRGDNNNLKSSIKSLIQLSDEKSLVPHGLGGHARKLLASAYHRIPDESEIPRQAGGMAPL